MSLPTVKIGGRVFTILFPSLLRPLTDSERQSLKNSIRKSGVEVAVVVDEDDGIIDGGNRATIAEEVGLKNIRTDMRKGLTAEQKIQLALDLNDARRHLSGTDRKQIKKDTPRLIAEALKANPEKANTVIAEEVGADDKTVGAVRIHLESTSEIPKLEKTIGKDGRARTTSPRKREREPGEDDDLYDQKDADKEAKRRESSKPKPKAQDATGRTIPDCVKDVFGDTCLTESIADIEEAARLTLRAHERLKRKIQYYPFAHVKDAFDSLADAEHALQLAADSIKPGQPHAVCPDCEGKGEGCKTCRFGGHLPEWRFRELQEQGAF